MIYRLINEICIINSWFVCIERIVIKKGSDRLLVTVLEVKWCG